MKIKTLEMITLHIPFYADYVTQHMQRALTHSEQVEVYRVELDNGVIGYGENLGDESGNFDRVIGQNAVCNHAGRQHRFRDSDVPV